LTLGGTGILPVKSGILPDFARRQTARMSKKQGAQ
jgi:hypothetical protein